MQLARSNSSSKWEKRRGETPSSVSFVTNLWLERIKAMEKKDMIRNDFRGYGYEIIERESRIRTEPRKRSNRVENRSHGRALSWVLKPGKWENVNWVSLRGNRSIGSEICGEGSNTSCKAKRHLAMEKRTKALSSDGSNGTESICWYWRDLSMESRRKIQDVLDNIIDCFAKTLLKKIQSRRKNLSP